MSGSGDQASSSKPPGAPKDDSWLLSKVGFKLVRPPQGKYSPRADERCITYCSQSVHGRMEKQEPWCRSVCIRRVFDHEVRARVRKPIREDQSIGSITQLETNEDMKYPLPPEGQRADEVPDGNSEADKYHRKLSEKEVKYWEEGWYLWYSKSRWAAQEKVDLMMHDLATQAGWYKHMARQKIDWEEYEKERKSRPGAGLIEAEAPTMTIASPPREHPDPSKLSLLVHLPPPLPPLYDQMQNLLAPTFKVTKIMTESLASGAQRELAGRIWAKAQTDEPFLLMRNVASKMWKLWQNDDDKGKD